MAMIFAIILLVSFFVRVQGQICQIIDDTNNTTVSPGCARDYNLACESWRNVSLWALMMFDSNGRPESGKFLGNLVFEGDYDQCVYPRKTGNIEHPMQEDLHFCMAFWPSVIEPVIAGHGLCLPRTCTPDDFLVILKQDHFRPLVEVEVSKYWCYDEDRSLASDAAAIISIAIFVLFGCVVLTSSIFHKVQLMRSTNETPETKPNTGHPQQTEESTNTTKLNGATLLDMAVNQYKLNDASVGKIERTTALPYIENGEFGEKQNQIANGSIKQQHSVENGVVGEKPRLENGVYCEQESPRDTGMVLEKLNAENDILGEKGHQSKNGTLGDDNTDVKLFKEVHDANCRGDDKSTLHVSTSEKITKMTSTFFLTFSLCQNVPKVLSAKRAKGSYDCLNGIRFLSMAWIVLAHTYDFVGFEQVDNATTGYYLAYQFWFQAIARSSYSVDTFFVLSAMLVTISFLKNMQMPKDMNSKGKLTKHYSKRIGLYSFHRYLRLTPVYAIVIMIHANLIQYIVWNGPFYSPGAEAQNCKKNWWINLLYLSNLLRQDQVCVGHGWYLANDFQFYIILPVFLAPLLWYEHARKKNTMSKSRQSFLFMGSMTWIGLTIAGSLISRLYLAYKFFAEEYLPDISPYVAPWCKSAVYFMATYLGYIIYRTNGNVRLPKVMVFLGWLVAAGCVSLPMYLQYLYSPYCDGPACTGEWTVAGKTVFIGLDRPMWALGIMWIIFACVNGYGGLANTILSWNGFIPLARLTYCCYLIHPLVCYSYIFASPIQHHLTHYTWAYIFLGNLCVSMAASFILTLLFEVPFLGIQKILLTPKTR